MAGGMCGFEIRPLLSMGRKGSGNGDERVPGWQAGQGLGRMDEEPMGPGSRPLADKLGPSSWGRDFAHEGPVAVGMARLRRRQ